MPFLRTVLLIGAAIVALTAVPAAARADADDVASPNSTSLGLQPLSAPIPAATPAPGESRTLPRPDGSYQAVPATHGRIKTFHLVAREAPWTLKPGPHGYGQDLQRRRSGTGAASAIRATTVVIDYRNELAIPDTIHLHGIHGHPRRYGRSRRHFAVARSAARRPLRYRLHRRPAGDVHLSHSRRQGVLDSRALRRDRRQPAHPRPDERSLAHDFLEIISSWYINSNAENHFTLNGKEYPATRRLDVRSGERFRIRWINISAEELPHDAHARPLHAHHRARRAPPMYARTSKTRPISGRGNASTSTSSPTRQPGPGSSTATSWTTSKTAPACPTG